MWPVWCVASLAAGVVVGVVLAPYLRRGSAFKRGYAAGYRAGRAQRTVGLFDRIRDRIR